MQYLIYLQISSVWRDNTLSWWSCTYGCTS